MDTEQIYTKSYDLNLLLNFDYSQRIPDKFKKIVQDDNKDFTQLANEIIYECYGEITDKNVSSLEDIEIENSTCPGQNKSNYLVGGPILPKSRSKEHYQYYNKETYKPEEDEDEGYWKSDQYKTKEEVLEFYKRHENETVNPVPVTEFNYLSRESQDRKNCEDTIQKLMLQLRKHELKSKQILNTNCKIAEMFNTVTICMGEFINVFQRLSSKDLGEELNRDVKKSLKMSQKYNKSVLKQFIKKLVETTQENEKKLADSSYKVLRYDTMVKICEALQLEVQFCRKAFGYKNLIVPDFDFSIHTKKDWTDKIPLDSKNLINKFTTFRMTDDVDVLRQYYQHKLEACADIESVDEIFSTMLQSKKLTKSVFIEQTLDNFVKEGIFTREKAEHHKNIIRSEYNKKSIENESCGLTSVLNTKEDVEKLISDTTFPGVEDEDGRRIVEVNAPDNVTQENMVIKSILDDVVSQIKSDFDSKIQTAKQMLEFSEEPVTFRNDDDDDSAGGNLPSQDSKDDYDSDSSEDEYGPITGGSGAKPQHTTDVGDKPGKSGIDVQSDEVGEIDVDTFNKTIISESENIPVGLHSSMRKQIKELQDEVRQLKQPFNKSLGIALDSNHFQDNTIKLKSLLDIDKESFYQEIIEKISDDASEMSESEKEEVNMKLKEIDEKLFYETDKNIINNLILEKMRHKKILEQSNLSKLLNRLGESMNRPDPELDAYLNFTQQNRILNYTKNEILNRYRHVPWKLSVYFEILNIQNRSILLDEKLSYEFSLSERNNIAKQLQQTNDKLLQDFALKEEDIIESRNQLYRNPIFYQQLEEAFMDGMNHTLNNIKYDDVINFHDIKNIFNSLKEREYNVDVLDSYQSYIYHPKTMFLPIDKDRKSKQLSIKKMGFSGINDKSSIVIPENRSNMSKMVKINENFSKFILDFKDKIQKLRKIDSIDSEIESYVIEFYNKTNEIYELVEKNDLTQFSNVYSLITELVVIFTQYYQGKLTILLKYKLTDQTDKNFHNIEWNTESSFDITDEGEKQQIFLVVKNYFNVLDKESKKLFIEKLRLTECLNIDKNPDEEEGDPDVEEADTDVEEINITKFNRIFSDEYEYSDDLIQDDKKELLIESLFGFFIAFIGDNWDLSKHTILSDLIKKLLISIYTDFTDTQINDLMMKYWNILVKNKLKIISMEENKSELTDEEKVTFLYINALDSSIVFRDVQPQQEEIDSTKILDEALKIINDDRAKREVEMAARVPLPEDDDDF